MIILFVIIAPLTIWLLIPKNSEGKELKDLKTDEDTSKIMRLLKVQAKLNEMRNAIAKELGTVVLK